MSITYILQGALQFLVGKCVKITNFFSVHAKEQSYASPGTVNLVTNMVKTYGKPKWTKWGI